MDTIKAKREQLTEFTIPYVASPIGLYQLLPYLSSQVLTI